MPRELFRRVYAAAAGSAGSAIETAWKYATATDAARELHEYPVALHKDGIPLRIKVRHAEVYKMRIAITSLRPLKYDNTAQTETDKPGTSALEPGR